MTLVPLPFNVHDFPSETVYRLNLFAICEALGLDVRRLAAYREAVRVGFFTDYPKEEGL